MVLPNFILIGAMKAGTTSLASYLGSHPEVFMAAPKEPGFFNPQRNWDRGLDWYEGLFARAGSFPARGEASTSYTKAPDVSGVPQRIASVLPDVRLVYLVRNPVERIVSHYKHDVDRGDEDGRMPLAEAVRRRSDYLDFSRYGMQLSLYLDVFPRDRVFVASSDRLRHDREHALAEILDFIGVSSSVGGMVLDRERHLGSDKRRVMPALEQARTLLRRSGVMARIPAAPSRRSAGGCRRRCRLRSRRSTPRPRRTCGTSSWTTSRCSDRSSVRTSIFGGRRDDAPLRPCAGSSADRAARERPSTRIIPAKQVEQRWIDTRGDGSNSRQVVVRAESQAGQSERIRPVGPDSVVEERGHSISETHEFCFGIGCPVPVGVGEQRGRDAELSSEPFMCPPDLITLFDRFAAIQAGMIPRVIAHL